MERNFALLFVLCIFSVDGVTYFVERDLAPTSAVQSGGGEGWNNVGRVTSADDTLFANVRLIEQHSSRVVEVTVNSTVLIPNFNPVFQIQAKASVNGVSEPHINLALNCTNFGDDERQRVRETNAAVFTRNVTGLLPENVIDENFRLRIRANALGGGSATFVRLHYVALKAYYYISPTINSIEPSSGSGLNPQTSVKIYGTDFFDIPGYEPRLRVDGNIQYCDYTSKTELTCIIPEAVAGGERNIDLSFDGISWISGYTFNYIEDQQERISSTSEKSEGFPIEAIIGAAAGALLLILVCVAVLFVLFVRRRKRDRKPLVEVELPSNYFPITSAEEGRSSVEGRPSSVLVRGSIERSTNWVIPSSDLIYQMEVGRGAFGIVFKGQWRGTPVAIKKLLREDMTDQDVEDFEREITLMKDLRPHSNVVQLFGICMNPLAIVTEYMEHGNLKTYLAEHPEISEETRKKIVLGIVRGMWHLHTERIVHRDLAVRNVLLTVTLEPKISDFGYSRAVSEDVSHTQSTVGPLRWMSPESLKHSEYSTASDVWAFGATLIEIYTGHPPSPSETALVYASKILNRQYSPVSEIPPQVTGKLRTVMEGCFQFEPKLRPSFKEIYQILETASSF